MGTRTESCVVIDCSYFTFDTEKMLSNDPYTTRSITLMKKSKLSVKDQVKNHGWKVEPDAVKFWEQQEVQVKKKILPAAGDLTVKEFVSEVHTYLSDSGKLKRWWCRGNTFDAPILWRLFEAENKENHLNQHLPNWQLRDLRTYIDAKLDFPIKNGFIPIKDEKFWNEVFQPHDSSWDILADILRLQTIMRVENDLEQTNR